ncbi:MAG: UDP-glucose 4-epimerase GalE [Sphaerochaetaceae bacterium]
MKVLLCGGAGYIGTHVALQFLDRGDQVGILDDLSSGLESNVDPQSTLYKGTLLDKAFVDSVLSKGWDVVIHLAAFKAAGESMVNPTKYALNNISGSLNLIGSCVEHDVGKFILSSSAAVYGEPEYLPIDEVHPTRPENYYGYTKLAIEENLRWFFELHNLQYASLRYFNAAGYDPDGRMRGLERNPANLIPVVMEVAAQKRSHIQIFGDDYPTDDGTGVRDYVHVTDLALAHALAADYLVANKEPLTVNLGSDVGLSVRQIIDATRKITQKEIKEEITTRRAGDPAKLVATSKKAKELLNWEAQYSSLESIIQSTWNVYSLLT